MKIYSTFLIIVLLFMAGCEKENAFQPPPPPEVTVGSPAVEDVTLYEIFPGQVEARDSVQIVARVPGVLEQIHFTDGQTVLKGDRLFTIEQESYQAALDAAKARLAQTEAARSLADAALKRKKRAYETRAVSELDVLAAEADLQAAEAALDSARAEVEQAELSLSYTEIFAPIDGVISSAAVSAGNLVGPGAVAELAFLVRVDIANVMFSIDERRLLPKLRMIAEDDGVRTENLPMIGLELADGKLYSPEGKIDYVDNVIDEATGTLQVRAVFDNPERLLVDGMFARVRIPVPVNDAMLVPETAVQRDLVGTYVYVLNDENLVEIVYLEIGSLIEGKRIVTKGLSSDARLVLKGIQRVRPGVRVTVSSGGD